MTVKKREGKRVPRYAQEDGDSISSIQKVAKEFIRMKRLNFNLTDKQKELVEILKSNKIITVTGPPGTSKTFIACYAAMQMFLSEERQKIILSKPTEVLSGTKDLGALPGSLEEKLKEYVESFTDAFDEFLQTKDFKHLWAEKMIEFKPAQFLRGRTLKDSFIIIDEFQNFDIKALKSIVTRLGRNSTIVFMGDTKQNDIGKRYVAVDFFNEVIKGIPGCASFEFKKEDIVREKILIDIIDRFEQLEAQGRMPDTMKNT
jgi:phosphate starvation-inducible PhoH-like protein